MGSVRRLARLLASLDGTRSGEPPSAFVPAADEGDDLLRFRPMSLVVQKGGADRGRIARVDSLGLIVRAKRHAEDIACLS